MKKATLTTTFDRLHRAGACPEGYRKLARYLGGVRNYGKHTPINLLTILESNGVDDMLWCLPYTIEDSDAVSRLIAADCAEQSAADAAWIATWCIAKEKIIRRYLK